jgi:hypothetical protein
MTSLLRQHKAIAADPSYDDNAANAMYLWCINTGELYDRFLSLVSQYSDDLDTLVKHINTQCLGQRKALANAEPDLGKVNNASCMGAAIAIADYYINVHK